MSTGVGGAIKRRGGDSVEFEAVRQAPVPLGSAVVTGPGRLAAKAVIHAVSIDRDRRTSAETIEAAVRSTMARVRELGAESIAFPALGTGVGGFPLEEAARVMVETVHDELKRSPRVDTVVFALRGSAPYETFQRALRASARSRASRPDEAAADGPELASIEIVTPETATPLPSRPLPDSQRPRRPFGPGGDQSQ